MAATAPAFAAQPKAPATTLDHKEFFRPELYISTSHKELSQVLDALPNKAAWERFLSSKAGAKVFIDPRSGAAANIIDAVPLIPGKGVGNDVTLASLGQRLGRTLTEVDSAAVADAFLQYVRAHQDVLGIDARQLGAVRATLVNPDLWQVSIPQVVAGVPVRHGRVAGTISHGNLIVIGAETWSNVATDVNPTVSAEAAEAAGFDYVEGRSIDDQMVKAFRLEMIPIAPPQFQKGEGFAGPVGQGIGHRLAWVFAFQRLPELARWEVLVDAHSGEVLSFEDTNHYVQRQVTGGVYPLTDTEVCPNPDQCGIMQANYPMPFTNTGFPAPNDFTNSAGIFQYTAGTTTTSLNGRFVRMVDTCGVANGTGAGDVPLGGANGQHDCTTPGTGGPGNTPASRAGMYELNKIIELAKGYLPTNTWLQAQLTANMNLNQTCNAFWNGTSVNFFRSGGGCRNTGEIAAVFDHEWGHGIDDNDANGTISNSGEGYADIASIYRLEASCVGHGFFQTVNPGCGPTADGTGFNQNEAQTGPQHCDLDCSGVRDSDYLLHNPNTPDTALGFVCSSCAAGGGPCGRQVHCSATAVRQAAWDLVARDLTGPPYNLDSQSAFIVGNKLFYHGSGNIGLWHSCTCGGTSDGCGALNGYMQWIAADDDNGNLADGTPHMTALFNAYDRHGIACATPTPTIGGCAGGPSAATNLTVSPGNYQVSLSWTAVAGATRYWVFRTEGHAGCNLGKALIAEVTGLSYVDSQVANGRTYYYNVVPAGASSACYGPAGTCQSATPVAAPGPTGLVATATGPNQIGLTWNAVPGASTYRVYRANGACPQTAFTQIATGLASPSYTDTAVSGGSTYAYVVTWVDASNAESAFSNCDDATATGTCTTPPTFAGVGSVTQPTPGLCRLDLSWTAGTATCPGATLKYNVYRSTDPVFIPGPANLRQSCVTGTTFSDTTVTSGNTYYYVVRAEDNGTAGTGPCNNGNTETNTIRKSGNPDTVTAFFDDMEGGTSLWVVDDPGPGNPWAVVTTQSNSPTHSWFVDDPPTVTDQRLAFANPVALTAGSTLSFFQRYDMELGPPPYDGGVLEYSLDGATWFDILAGNGGTIPPNAARITAHPYQVTPISGGFMNPLAGRRAWSGAQNSFVETRVDLADFAGNSVRFRWRRGTDNSVAAQGWWVDDVRITRQQACSSASFIRGDFDYDGKTDILWRHDESGENVVWFMNGAVLAGGTFTTPAALTDTRWKMVGTHDFNADLKTDILWRHDTSGENVVWFMNGTVLTTGTFTTPSMLADVDWKMAGTGLFDGDSKPDIAWHHQVAGQIVLWYMNGTFLTSGTFTTPSSFPDTNWRLVGVADFSVPADNKPDFVWRNQATGGLLIWYMNNDVQTGTTATTPPELTDTRWKLVATGDYNLDLKNDFVWRHDTSGENVVWYMNGAVLQSGTFTNPASFPDVRWKMVGPR